MIPESLRPLKGLAYPLASTSHDDWRALADALRAMQEHDRATHAHAIADGLTIRNRAVLVGRDKAGRTRIVSPDYPPDIFAAHLSFLPRFLWLTDAHLRAAHGDVRFRLAFDGERAGWRWTYPGMFRPMVDRMPLAAFQFFHAIAESIHFAPVYPHAFVAGGAE